MAPAAGWRPPFPYRRDEVVFEAPDAEETASRLSIAIDYQSLKQPRLDRLDGGTRSTRKTPVGAMAVD
jgi:hypothetical protein